MFSPSNCVDDYSLFYNWKRDNFRARLCSEWATELLLLLHAFLKNVNFKNNAELICASLGININCETDSNTGKEQIDKVNDRTDDHLYLESETEEEEDLEYNECGKVSDYCDDCIEHRG